MFDIGWGELVVIGIVALIAIGPKELPGVLRACGQWMGKIRRMANEFQGQFQEAMREAELSELKKEAEKLTSIGNDIGTLNPLAETQKEIESHFEDKPAAPLPESEVVAANESQPAAPAPEVKVDVPLPEMPSPLDARDFAPAEADPVPASKKAVGEK